jgi:pimeloyl-ACP methyl ester carboxylesterase
MKKLILLSLTLLVFLNACKKQHKNTFNKNDSKVAKEIVFHTKDNIKIYGDLYQLDKTNPIILLFHKGRSNARGEYNSIIPLLINNGFNVLSIDQRLGGQDFGSYNRTVANILNSTFNYCDAYADLESALNFVIDSGFSGKKILWGSSYSGSLAIKLANEYQTEVSGVLAFSPASGGPMKNCRADEYFETLKVPLLLLRPAKELEIESSQKQFELAQSFNHQTYIAKNGFHGSSMLVENRVKNNVDDNWKSVLSFLGGLQK